MTTVCHLSFSAEFVAQCARLIVDRLDARFNSSPAHSRSVSSTSPFTSTPPSPPSSSSVSDLTDCLVVIPNPAVAPALRAALADAAGCALLLPRIVTLAQWVQFTPSTDTSLSSQPDSLRQLTLYRELKKRAWFAEGALWAICAELISLFDELTVNSVRLPENEDEFIAQLEHAYALRGSQALRFEAQVVHALWRAEADGLPSRKAASILTLSRLAANAIGPLFVLCEGEPTLAEMSFYDAWAERQPATVFVPHRHLPTQSVAETLAPQAPTPLPPHPAPLMQLLNFAWPSWGDLDGQTLAQRADEAAEKLLQSPLSGRMHLIGAVSLEEEAQTVVAEVHRWLVAGKRRIALVAADRVAARRARALLERDGVLVEDETGWKLSTTRAAALIDAWMEVVAADAYHRDLLDLVKSPFVAGVPNDHYGSNAVQQLERGLARHNLKSGLRRYELVLADDHTQDYGEALALLQSVVRARRAMPRSAASLAEWLSTLESALSELSALERLEADEAGKTVLNLLRIRREELVGEPYRMGFSEWREWLNRELESAAFVDRSIVSPIVMTHLAATRLRTFDAVIIIGADRENLAPVTSEAVFSHQAVRAELGLPTFAEAKQQLRDDLAFLIAASGEVSATWQTQRNDEANLLAPELATLSLLHQRAWGGDLKCPPSIVSRIADAGALRISNPTLMPAPQAPKALLPTRVSASAYASLIACPYQFFARRVLGLNEADEVEEEVEKRHYGEFVHRILNTFHTQFADFSAHSDEALEAALTEITETEFKLIVDDNFLNHAWLIRWRSQVSGYIAWQRQRESQAWRYVGGELKRELETRLDDGATLILHGRLDRLDKNLQHEFSVLDYKTQKIGKLNARVLDADDVQLSVYTMLQGEAVTEAAYVALDDKKVAAVALDDPQSVAQNEYQRLTYLFSSLHAGAPMPAHGIDAVCNYCEMRGLCRKDYHAEESDWSKAQQGLP